MLDCLEICIKSLIDKWEEVPSLQINKIQEQFNHLKHWQIEPVLSNLLLVFSYVETLFCLVTAYNLKTDNKDQIIKNTKNNMILNIGKYFLNNKNIYFQKNRWKFTNIKAKDIRDLRNDLVHFYSITPKSIVLSDSSFDKESTIKQTLDRYNITIISSLDLFELTKSWSEIFIKQLANDCKGNQQLFNEKIEVLKKIIGKKAAVKMHVK